VKKEGVLYKQREHFRGWLPRYFTLDSHFLHYYLDRGDVLPRKSLQICKGVIVTTDVVAKVSNGIAYYAFTISHPQSASEYKLSTTSLSESCVWVQCIQEVIDESGGVFESEKDKRRSTGVNKNNSRSSSPPETKRSIKIKKQSEGTIPVAEVPPEPDDPDDPPTAPYRRKAVLAGLSESLSAKVEAAAEKLLQYTYSTDWLPMFEKRGVIATRMAGSGVVCVRGETLLPYTIPEIYGYVCRAENRKSLDAQMDVYTRVKWFSPHTGVEHILFKPVWPTAPRDFVNVTHWRLLRDGTFITLGFSERIEMCPEQEGVVRGSLLIGGYVMQHVPGGTKISIVVQVCISL
jgi:hypothetical protein